MCVPETRFLWVLGWALRFLCLPGRHFPCWASSPTSTEFERWFYLLDISLSLNIVPATRYKPLLMDDGKKHIVGGITSNNGEFDMDRLLKQSSEERLESWKQALRCCWWEEQTEGARLCGGMGQKDKEYAPYWGGWAQRAKLLNAGYHLDYLAFVLPERPFCLAPVTPLKS